MGIRNMGISNMSISHMGISNNTGRTEENEKDMV